MAIFWPKMVLFCTYGWFVPFSGWFSVQFYLGQFKLSRFLCGDFDFAIIAKNWHFFRVTLWYFFFYKIVVFLTLHQTRVRWVKRLENEFSGKWRALIGWLENVRTWEWFGLAERRWCHFFFFFSSNNDETLKREKLFELEVFLKVYLFYYQGYLLKLSEDN